MTDVVLAVVSQGLVIRLDGLVGGLDVGRGETSLAGPPLGRRKVRWTPLSRPKKCLP